MIESNYSQAPVPTENSNKKKLLVLVGGGILLLLVIGMIVFFVHKKNQSKTLGQVQTNGNSSVSSNSNDTSSTPVVQDYPNDLDRDGVDDTKEKELGLSNRDFDTDGDGLSDADEMEVWHTDPKKADTDGDKFSDGYEVLKGYDPLGPGKLTP